MGRAASLVKVRRKEKGMAMESPRSTGRSEITNTTDSRGTMNKHRNFVYSGRESIVANRTTLHTQTYERAMQPWW